MADDLCNVCVYLKLILIIKKRNNELNVEFNTWCYYYTYILYSCNFFSFLGLQS